MKLSTNFAAPTIQNMSDEVVAAPEEIKEVEAPAGEEAPASVQEEPVAEEESKVTNLLFTLKLFLTRSLRGFSS